MKIRPYHPTDVDILIAIWIRSVKQLAKMDYTAEQIDAWLSRVPSAETLNRLADDQTEDTARLRLVAENPSGAPIGFIDLEADGHIDFLYCDPTAAGKGVATALLREIEAIARARGTNRLYSEASETAQGVFLSNGFVLVGRRECIITGVEIHNYAVEKFLGGPVMPADARLQHKT